MNTPSRRILVAEDEQNIRDMVVLNLAATGADIVQATNGAEAWETYLAEEGEFDLALLDIMMPELDGLELAQRIREQNPRIGIIFLSAKSQEDDKVQGLLSGADDYITKPFSPSELRARVESVLRRVNMPAPAKSPSSVLQSGEFLLDMRGRWLKRNGARIELTNIELALMELFMQNPGKELSRVEIFAEVWGDASFADAKIVDVNVRRLRLKIEDDPSNPQRIATVWGQGYKFSD
ncbi:MAG: response regulator transcription factor [Oscillospiraceae bacterium]|nr:response regulator transcription factor [Oscillospiraceae bacterium]